MTNPKKSRGRQKIEMKKISKESNLQVTFSKRRNGLFKKASELCTLCGADVALVVFSPGEKVFSFGHPNVDVVIDRYLTRPPLPNSIPMEVIKVHRITNVSELNVKLTRINNQLDAGRKHSEELTRLKKAMEAQMWWASSIKEMSRAQLDEYKVALEGLKKHVTLLVDRARLQVATNPTQFFPEASSSSNLVHQPHPHQVFPPQLIQPLMLQNYIFVDGTMMHHHEFNNMGMGGYRPIIGFF